jgi:hypothetical protein
MRDYLTVILLILSFLFLSKCTPNAFEPGDDLETLASWMTGSFSSEEQSLADTSYFDIRLKMVRIWPERTDAYWLYVEQAVHTFEDKPYRQRVYRVSQLSADLFESRVFTFEDPERFAGAWDDENPLSSLTPDSLTLKKGCAIVLRRTMAGTFAGNTVGKECPTDLRGAYYAVADVQIDEKTLTTWDQGFDADGNQVWGPTEGGYVFKKTVDFPLE